MNSAQLRTLLTRALPDWALIVETGIQAAPFVGFHRFGVRVFVTAIQAEDCDAGLAMAQLVDTATAFKMHGNSQGFSTTCWINVFDDERDAATFMRDVRRLTRRHDCNARSAESEIPV